MHIYKFNINGNPNIGLFIYANDQYCLVGKTVQEKHLDSIKEALKVPVHRISIAGTSLLGAFLAGNDNCLLVPETAYDDELEVLKKLKIKFEVINTRLTALGNNIVATNDGAYVAPDFEIKEKNQIKKALDVNLRKGLIAECESVGSLLAHNNEFGIIHNEAIGIGAMEKLLNIKIYKGTVNMGSPYVKSGLVANKNGFLIGGFSSGPETANIDEYLGFLR